jgi:pyruvate/2-oxoglutarate dehydrogenase complex dihydrolipoamide dehydrogenase (E3) component
MTRKFDLIAIGTGSAASGVTSRCREAGWKVAIVDSRPFGGTCALRGCDPKKVLVGAAEAVDWTRRMKGRGIQAAELQIDWPELMRFKRSFTEPVTKRREDDFVNPGIAAFHGRARFAGPTTVQIGEETRQVSGSCASCATANIPSPRLRAEIVPLEQSILLTCCNLTRKRKRTRPCNDCPTSSLHMILGVAQMVV